MAELVRRAARIIRRTDPAATVGCPSTGHLRDAAALRFLREFAAADGARGSRSATRSTSTSRRSAAGRRATRVTAPGRRAHGESRTAVPAARGSSLRVRDRLR